jgi:hypothetical protein
MRTLWSLLSFLAIVNLLALVMVVGWLWQSGRLTRGRIDDIRAVLALPESQAAAAASRSVSEAEKERLRLMEEARRAHPPTDSATQIEQVAFVQQQQEHVRRRLEDERTMLSLTLTRATAQLEASITAFERERAQWQSSRSDDTQRKIDEQFLQVVRQLEQLPAKQAKGILQSMVADNNVDQVIAYLDAMSPRAAAKVLREFKSDVEMPLAASLLERLRTFGVPSAGAAPANEKPEAAMDSDSRDAANTVSSAATSASGRTTGGQVAPSAAASADDAGL